MQCVSLDEDVDHVVKQFPLYSGNILLEGGGVNSNVGRQRNYLKLVIGNKRTNEINNNSNGLKIIKSGIS